jgi:hypothetical protein
VSSIKNKNLLSDLRASEEVMRVFTNGGSQDYSEIGTLKRFPFNVYYSPQSLANILSLAQVSEMFRVTMDTNEAPTMMVHVIPNLVLRFQQCGSGLYYYDTAVNDNNSTVIPYSFLSTVRRNKDYLIDTKLKERIKLASCKATLDGRRRRTCGTTSHAT